MQIGGADEGSPPGGRPGSPVACIPVERDRRWPRSPARWPARGGGGRDAALAAMGTVGIQLGSADEGSP
jgi:hypothetical protein